MSPRALMLFLPLFSSCGQGLMIGGSYLSASPSTITSAQLSASLAVALTLGEGTSDPKLHGKSEASLDGWVVYTTPDHVSVHDGLKVTGWTSCQRRMIVVGTPPSGWAESALVHEFFHVFQACESTAPTDITSDELHANWTRDGLYDAIIRARADLKGI